MSAHDVRMFGDQIAASRLESRFARVKATSLIRLVIEDLYPGRVALVSSFGADAAALLHMVSRVDKSAPVIFVDTYMDLRRDEAETFLEAFRRVSIAPFKEALYERSAGSDI